MYCSIKNNWPCCHVQPHTLCHGACVVCECDETIYVCDILLKTSLHYFATFINTNPKSASNSVPFFAFSLTHLSWSCVDLPTWNCDEELRDWSNLRQSSKVEAGFLRLRARDVWVGGGHMYNLAIGFSHLDRQQWWSFWFVKVCKPTRKKLISHPIPWDPGTTEIEEASWLPSGAYKVNDLRSIDSCPLGSNPLFVYMHVILYISYIYIMWISAAICTTIFTCVSTNELLQLDKLVCCICSTGRGLSKD